MIYDNNRTLVILNPSLVNYCTSVMNSLDYYIRNIEMGDLSNPKKPTVPKRFLQKSRPVTIVRSNMNDNWFLSGLQYVGDNITDIVVYERNHDFFDALFSKFSENAFYKHISFLKNNYYKNKSYLEKIVENTSENSFVSQNSHAPQREIITLTPSNVPLRSSPNRNMSHTTRESTSSNRNQTPVPAQENSVYNAINAVERDIRSNQVRRPAKKKVNRSNVPNGGFTNPSIY